MDDDNKRKDTGARVDDIMNLSGGGAFGAALAAPILAPPPLEPIDLGVTSMEPTQSQGSKTLIFAILGGCALIAIGIVAAVALTRGPSPTEDKTGAKGAGSVSPDTTGSVAALDTNTPPTGATAPTGDTPPPPGTGNTATKPGSVNVAPKGGAPAGGGGVKPPDHNAGAAAAAGGGGGGAAPAPAPAPAPAAGPKDLSGALAEAAGKKPEAPSAGGGGTSSAPFDRGAAAAALGGVNVQSCKKSDGPTGSGHVTVTFGPDGSVQSAVVDSGPFPGTPVGGCIAGKYRGAHVPAFGGAPVRVGKSFTLN
jgi:hypothetical protein